jgi:hypothetical protein
MDPKILEEFDYIPYPQEKNLLDLKDKNISHIFIGFENLDHYLLQFFIEITRDMDIQSTPTFEYEKHLKMHHSLLEVFLKTDASSLGVIVSPSLKNKALELLKMLPENFRKYVLILK